MSESSAGIIYANPTSDEIVPNANGILTPNGTHYSDETDQGASRQPHQLHQVESQRVHIIWDLFAVASILTFVSDITSDIVVSVLYFIDGSYLWFSLTLGFVILSSIVMQVFSAKWFYEDNEDQTWRTYLLHIFQMGPLFRYWLVIKAGWRTRQKNSTDRDYEAYLAEWRDISMLRLFECFIESAPQLVLQLYIMAHNRRFDIESDLFTALAAGSSLVSLAWAIVAYTKALRDFLGKGDNMSWIGFFLQIVWRMSMVASRVVALVLFASYYTIWLFVTMAAHWFLMTAWLVCQKTRFCVDDNGRNHCGREYLFDSIIGFVYIFCFFNAKNGMTRIRVIPYYVIMLCENTVFIVMWYPFRTLYGDIETASLTVVWGGFGLGVICMLSYYRFYHPSLPVKGICVKKSQLDMENNQHFTICWCCCCEMKKANEDRCLFSISERPFYEARRNMQAQAQARGSLPMDVDIYPRMKSRESHSHLPENGNHQPASNGIIHGTQSMYRTSEWL